jgi:non-lysosomal glucosylceramidase
MPAQCLPMVSSRLHVDMNTNGPKGDLAFSPRITPENFKAAFTTAEGWGSFIQERNGARQVETIDLKWGKLTLKTLAFDVEDAKTVSSVTVSVGGREVRSSHSLEKMRVRITLDPSVTLRESERLQVDIT